MNQFAEIRKMPHRTPTSNEWYVGEGNARCSDQRSKQGQIARGNVPGSFSPNPLGPSESVESLPGPDLDHPRWFGDRPEPPQQPRT